MASNEWIWLLHGEPVEKAVEDFIQEFRSYGKEVTTMFTSGKCYWFSFILKERFSCMPVPGDPPKPKIMYDPIEGHFTTKICGEYYDITGNVTEKYKDRSFDWDALDDPTWKDRITRDCVQ